MVLSKESTPVKGSFSTARNDLYEGDIKGPDEPTGSFRQAFVLVAFLLLSGLGWHMINLKNKWSGRVSMLFLALSSLLFSACGDIKISPMEAASFSSSDEGQLCVAGSEVRYSKVLFIMDKSGSNNQSDPNSGSGTRRSRGMQIFLNQTKQDPFTKYGLITFQGSPSGGDLVKSWTPQETLQPNFVAGDQFQSALDESTAAADANCTPVNATLQMAKRAIQNDMEKNPEESSVYNIFYVTDGIIAEINNCSGIGVGDPEPPVQLIKELKAIAPDRITLSTVYYGKNDQATIDVQKRFAESGGGKFINIQNDELINFSDIITGPKKESWILRQFMVYNLNSAFCLDGIVAVDSDGDGLCDKDEVDLNSRFKDRLDELSQQSSHRIQFDPLNRNSIDTNYSDLFALKSLVLPTGDGLPSCTDPKKLSFDILNSCEKNLFTNYNPTGRTPAWTDYLNANGKKAETLTPDNDGDGFIDLISFFQFQLYSAPLNFNNLNINYQGYSGYQLLEQHRHFRNPASNPRATYNISVIPNGINSKGETCYSVNQQQLALYPTQPVDVTSSSGLNDLAHDANENVVLVYYIAVPEKDPNGQRIAYHYSYQKLKFVPKAIENVRASWLRFDQFDVYETRGRRQAFQ